MRGTTLRRKQNRLISAGQNTDTTHNNINNQLITNTNNRAACLLVILLAAYLHKHNLYFSQFLSTYMTSHNSQKTKSRQGHHTVAKQIYVSPTSTWPKKKKKAQTHKHTQNNNNNNNMLAENLIGGLEYPFEDLF